MTNTDDRSTWLRTGPLTAEQREATLASLRDGDITAHEAASLLGVPTIAIAALKGACARSGRSASVGALVRRFYVAQPHECWSLVDEGTELQSMSDAARIGRAHLVPVIEMVIA